MEWLKNVDDGELYPIPDDSEQKSAEKIPGYLAEVPQRKSIENDFDNNIAIVNLQKELTETKKELVSVKESQSISLEKVSAVKQEDKLSDVPSNWVKKVDWRTCIIGALFGLLIALIIMLVNKNTYTPENAQPDSTSASYSDTVDVNVQPDTAEEPQIQQDENSDSQKSDNATYEAADEVIGLNGFSTILLRMMKILLPIAVVAFAIRIGLKSITKMIKGD